MLARSNHYFTTSLDIYSLSGATDLKIKIKSGSGAAMFNLLLWILLATVTDATWENVGSQPIQWDFRTRPLQIKTPSRHQFDLIICELRIELQSKITTAAPHLDTVAVEVTESSMAVSYCDGKKSIKTDFDDQLDSPFHFKSGDECYWIVSRVGGLHTNISLNDHLVFTKPTKPDKGDDHECLLQEPTAQIISFAVKSEEASYNTAEMCGVLKIPNSVNGTYKEAPPGTTLPISCREGFTLHGPRNVTCQDTLSWTEPIPKCDVTRCPGFSVPNSDSYHGDQESVGVGQNVSLDCDVGYELVGDSNLTCLDDGTWDSEIPKCEPEESYDEKDSDNDQEESNDEEDPDSDVRNNTCPDIPHAKLTQTNQANKYEVSCNHGYVSITTNNTIVTCDDGEWLEDVPECEKPGTPDAKEVNSRVLLNRRRGSKQRGTRDFARRRGSIAEIRFPETVLQDLKN
eukprot:sb/3464545/